jgi:FecR protein
MYRSNTIWALLLVAGLLSVGASAIASAQDSTWHVSKSSGPVWVVTSGAQPASLSTESILNPGDTIRTGPNGRVLLTRGEETVLIAPNSVIALPAAPRDGLATTIIEQAGSVLIQAEKRNVKHFQVETPYLAAVVKGTQFRVSVDQRGSSVNVLAGQVEVTDFKSGQHALVLPGQTAQVSLRGSGGLSLGGTGTLSPIQQGTPRTPPAQLVPVPKGGLTTPRGLREGETVHALHEPRNSHVTAVGGQLQIKSSLGQVTLDISKVTHGLARATTSSTMTGGPAAQQTIWSSGAMLPGNGASQAYDAASSNSGAGNSNGHAAGNGNKNGNGNAAGNGNQNGNDNGAANGNANNGNHGNGNNGNGKARGHI